MPYDAMGRWVPVPGQLPNSPLLQNVPQAQQAPQQKPLQPEGAMSAAEQAQIAALLGTFGDTMEVDAQEKQLAQAEALRQDTPEGRQAGRVYVAANPLEHIGKGIGDYKLMKKRKATEEKTSGLRKRIGENVSTYGKLALKDL